MFLGCRLYFHFTLGQNNIVHFTVEQLTPLITRLYAAIHLPVSNTTTWVFKSDQTATEMPKSRLTEMSIKCDIHMGDVADVNTVYI